MESFPFVIALFELSPIPLLVIFWGDLTLVGFERDGDDFVGRTRLRASPPKWSAITSSRSRLARKAASATRWWSPSASSSGASTTSPSCWSAPSADPFSSPRPRWQTKPLLWSPSGSRVFLVWKRRLWLFFLPHYMKAFPVFVGGRIIYFKISCWLTKANTSLFSFLCTGEM